MSKITTLFIDKGGVLVDNAVLGAEFRRLLGEYLPTQLGGRSDAWAVANLGAHERAFARYLQASASGTPDAGIRAWYSRDSRDWLYDMCDAIGIPRPWGAEAERIADDAFAYVLDHVNIKVPRIVDALRDLTRRGLTLHVASGDRHDDLVRYLRTIEASSLFQRVYGPDLIDVWKFGAQYYRAILADTRTDPANAIVIDDSDRAIGWAAECGLRGVLVHRRNGELFEDAVLRAFGEAEAML